MGEGAHSRQPGRLIGKFMGCRVLYIMSMILPVWASIYRGGDDDGFPRVMGLWSSISAGPALGMVRPAFMPERAPESLRFKLAQ